MSMFARQNMEWNRVTEDGLNYHLPNKGVEVLVYKPTGMYGKYSLDTWNDLYEAPVSWSSVTICVGEGWQDEDDFSAITHWAYLNEPDEE